jgi:hypothetical protein
MIEPIQCMKTELKKQENFCLHGKIKKRIGLLISKGRNYLFAGSSNHASNNNPELIVYLSSL